jgi:hypothetical protein
MEYDLDRSTVTIGGHRYPAVTPVCPPVPGDDSPPEDRKLWGAPDGTPPPIPYQRDFDVWIPTEAGFLIQVVEHEHPSAGDDNPHLELRLDARTCTPWDQDEGGLIPHSLSVLDGRVLGWTRHGISCWDQAEPDWIHEFTHYVSRLPYDEPPGPLLDLFRLGHFFRDCAGLS